MDGGRYEKRDGEFLNMSDKFKKQLLPSNISTATISVLSKEKFNKIAEELKMEEEIEQCCCYCKHHEGRHRLMQDRLDVHTVHYCLLFDDKNIYRRNRE